MLFGDSTPEDVSNPKCLCRFDHPTRPGAQIQKRDDARACTCKTVRMNVSDAGRHGKQDMHNRQAKAELNVYACAISAFQLNASAAILALFWHRP